MQHDTGTGSYFNETTAVDLTKYPAYESIPFDLPDIVQSVKTTKSRPATIVEDATGEAIQATIAGKQTQVWRDSAPYIKMFPDGLKIITRLSIKGLTILEFILRRLTIGQVVVELRVSEVMKAHKNLAGGRYYQGLEELLQHGYMVRKKGPKNQFFINPNFFFNGDRKWIKSGI